MNKQKTSIDLISLVNSHDKPFVVINRNYQVLAFNAAYEKEYKIKLDESVGKMCYEVIKGRGRPCKLDGDECPHYDVFKSSSDSSTPSHYDVTRDSKRVRITAFPLKNSDEELLLGKCVDIIFQSTYEFNNAENMVGQSKNYNRCKSYLDVAANSDIPVLITGDTGTGKELAANYIHQRSSRNSFPLQIIDCTTLTEASFDLEIFGHEAGAFTGCIGDKLGIFEISDGGTIFLDKISDLKPSLQSKLLRLLETGTFRRVGGDKVHEVDVRIIAATNKNLWASVGNGEFREDLYHRLACLNIRMPSLSERIDDIPVISRAIVENINSKTGSLYSMPDGTAEHLKEFTYSGNIRELKNIILAATTLTDTDEISKTVIDEVVNTMHPSAFRKSGEEKKEIPTIEQVIEHNYAVASIKELEARHIRMLLEKFDGNRKKTADALGVTERTLYRKLTRLGISKKAT